MLAQGNIESQGREKMIKPKGAERRRYPRIDKELPIKIAANGYAFATSTLNLSCVGAYCHLDKYIPPFTKIAVKLSLPMATREGKKDMDVECQGVVVRTEDDKRGGFNLAVFFNRIQNTQRKKISQYINQFLPQKSS